MHKSYPFVGQLVSNADELPVPPPVALFGRENLLSNVKRQLDANGVVLLHGKEGTGKTTIAAALTALVASAHQVRVLWINAGDDSLGDLCDQVGRGFNDRNIIDAPGLDVQIERAQASLKKHAPLVVLDHVINEQAAREFVRRVANGLPVLLTVPSQLAGPWIPLAVETLNRKAAVSLFYTHSRLTPDDQVQQVAALCDRLDNHPLAVETAGRLVAADADIDLGVLLKALPPRHDLPPGANTVQTVLRILLKRLPAGEKVLLLALGGMFAGGGTIPLLSTVSGLPPEQIKLGLDRLEIRGLVHMVQGHHATMHSLVHQFVRDVLQSMGRLDSAEAHTVSAVTAYATEHAGDDDALGAEWGNLQGALEWAARSSDANSVSAIAEAIANSTLLTINGHARLRDQLARASTTGGEAPAPSEPPPDPAVSDSQGRRSEDNLLADGDEHLAEGSVQEAIARYKQALQAAQQTQNPRRMAQAALRLGQAYDMVEEFEPAMQHYRQAMEIAKTIQDTATQSLALASLSAAFIASGQIDKGIAAAERALPALEATGQRSVLARTYNTLGVGLSEKNQIEEALAQYRKALEMARQADDRGAEYDALFYAGDAQRRIGDYAQAAAGYREALILAGQMGDREAEERALGTIGLNALEMGDLSNAVDTLKLAVETAQELGGAGHERDWVGYLAQAYQQLGQHDEALAASGRAVELARTAGDRYTEAASLNNMALLLSWRGQYGEAVELYGQALEIAREIGARADEAVFLSNLGMSYTDMGATEEAIRHYQQALEIARELGDTRQEANALSNLGVAYSAVNRWEDALACHTQALEIARAGGDLAGQSDQLGNAGRVYRVMGRREEAVRAFREALNLAYRLEDVEGQAAWLYHLGSLLMDNMPKLADAVSMLEEAYTLYDHLDHPMTDEVQRHLRRAQKRLERAEKTGIEILPPTTPEYRRRAAGLEEDVQPAAAGEDAPPEDLPL